MNSSRGFASDNSATVHPAVLGAIARVNVGHTFGYGHDEFSHQVEGRFAEQFGGDARAYFVFNGTAANVLSMRAVCRPWQAAICATTAHVNVDECGAPEAIAGVKLLTVATEHGKLTPELAETMIARVGDEHVARPRLITISQCTELGTVYTRSEVQALAGFAHDHAMLLHVTAPGSRNAAAALESAAVGDHVRRGRRPAVVRRHQERRARSQAVVFLNPPPARRRVPIPTQAYHAARVEDALPRRPIRRAAERRVAAPLRDEVNSMAARLADAVRDLPWLQITRPAQTNAVFATLPPVRDRGPSAGSSRSTSGMTTPASSLHCAADTRPRMTWIRSLTPTSTVLC